MMTCPRDDTEHILVEGVFNAAPGFLRSHHGVGHQRVVSGILGDKTTQICYVELTEFMLRWEETHAAVHIFVH